MCVWIYLCVQYCYASVWIRVGMCVGVIRAASVFMIRYVETKNQRFVPKHVHVEVKAGKQSFRWSTLTELSLSGWLHCVSDSRSHVLWSLTRDTGTYGFVHCSFVTSPEVMWWRAAAADCQLPQHKMAAGFQTTLPRTPHSSDRCGCLSHLSQLKGWESCRWLLTQRTGELLTWTIVFPETR